jgi:hypothetical protein
VVQAAAVGTIGQAVLELLVKVTMVVVAQPMEVALAAVQVLRV